MTREGVAARTAAYKAVRRVHEQDSWATPAVSTSVADLVGRDRGFAVNLAYQTLRWEGTLDWALAHVLRRDDVDPAVRDILRMGAWQIGYSDAPSRAAVDTSVELTREHVGARATGFVNGVLRSLARRWDSLPWPDASTDEGLGIRLGYPTWIVKQARERFGDQAAAVLRAGNDPPGVTLRAGDATALVAELAAEGLEASLGAHARDAVRVPGAVPGELAAVEQGRATVQDEASMVVTEALLALVDGPAPSVLDACAGPGGKATHLAMRGAKVTATDRHSSRARMVAQLGRRLGAEVAVAAADATHPPWRPDAFDAVLLDVPCSGLGVVRRRPELRWRRDSADLASLTRLQTALFDASAQLVTVGGILLYSACTWTSAETGQIVSAGLRRHSLEHVPLPATVPGQRLDGEPGVLLRPDVHGTDGMYIAAMRRTRA